MPWQWPESEFNFRISGWCEKIRWYTWAQRYLRYRHILSLFPSIWYVNGIDRNCSNYWIGWWWCFCFSLQLGKYTWDEVHKSGMDKYQKYGDIVKERMVPGVDVVWLFDPNDIAKVLNNSGPDMYPQRRSHLGLEQYRKDRPHIYKTAGVIAT